MDKIVELLKLKAQAIDAANALKAKAKTEKRDLTDEEMSAICAHIEEAEKHANEVKALEVKKEKMDKLALMTGEINSIPAPVTQTSEIEVGKTAKEKQLEDPKKGYVNHKAFLMDVFKAYTTGKCSDLLSVLDFSAAVGGDEQSTFADPFGGFFVPEGFSPMLLKIDSEMDFLSSRVRSIPMANPVVKIPARTDKNHSTSVTGGLRFFRRAEADTVATSRMEIEEVKLEAQSLMGITFATEEVLRDSAISFISLLADGFGDELAFFLTGERINGTGTGEFLGVTNSAAFLSIAKEGSQTADTIVLNNILKMRARCWGFQNAIWIANQDTISSLGTIRDAGNNNIFLMNAREDVPEVLLGRPIFFSEHVNTLGDANDIILVNWNEYLEGTYQPLESAESIHVRFVNNERAFRFTIRNDGRPWWRSVLTPKNGATLSPYVGLAERA